MEEIKLDTNKKISYEENNHKFEMTIEEIKEKLKDKIYHCGVKINKENTQKFLREFKDA